MDIAPIAEIRAVGPIRPRRNSGTLGTVFDIEALTHVELDFDLGKEWAGPQRGLEAEEDDDASEDWNVPSYPTARKSVDLVA